MKRVFLICLLIVCYYAGADDSNHADSTSSSGRPLSLCDDFSSPPLKSDQEKVLEKSPIQVPRNILLRDLLLNAFDYREPLKEPTPKKFEGKKGNIVS